MGAILEAVDVDPAALLALHAASPELYPALFESAAAGEPLGRFDILFAHPAGQLVATTGAAQGFLPALDEWWQRERTAVSNDSRGVPFVGGWLVYLGYELAGQIEPRLRLPQPIVGPIAQAIRIPAAVVHEHRSSRCWIVAEPSAAALIPRIAADLRRATRLSDVRRPLVESAIAEDDPRQYLQAVQRALDYIGAGDVYQANLSRAWRATLRPGVEPHEVYRRLRQTNPGPFSGVALLEGIAVVSSSPERLVSVHDGVVTTRPIAGTRPRGADPAADLALARELHAHPKERAEHVMLIDLERNDLGRVCEAGSVHVDELMTIESYAHVHHIVSNVRGRLRAAVTPGNVLAAVFPGGTITGCPKVRCMEIIAELEGSARGAYTGSLGYLNRDGSMDMNILIRSAQLSGRELTLRAGAGIVADSIPERELAETRAKARGVLRALGVEEGVQA
ncbi:MAG TPA: aminodeoxychorismate synthase component I [Steroidobacteraceae bacterium]|nr:aminodeoxychorismate synthase component I [Steroidobacteraceae bacterium]